MALGFVGLFVVSSCLDGCAREFLPSLAPPCLVYLVLLVKTCRISQEEQSLLLVMILTSSLLPPETHTPDCSALTARPCHASESHLEQRLRSPFRNV